MNCINLSIFKFPQLNKQYQILILKILYYSKIAIKVATGGSIYSCSWWSYEYEPVD
jgi:hypothetical protein